MPLITYQVSPSDPVVAFDVDSFVRAAATILKANGVTTNAQLTTIEGNITAANGFNANAAALLRALAAAFTLTP